MSIASSSSTVEASAETAFLNDPATPRWIKDVFRFLPVKSQFILSGNIRDVHSFPIAENKRIPRSLTQYLTETLKLRGYRFCISFNAIDGFQPVFPRGEPESDIRVLLKEKFKLNFDDAGRFKCSLDKSVEFMERIVSWKDDFVAVCADFASRYTAQIGNPTPAEHEYFTRMLMLGHGAQPHVTAAIREAQFNPIFWICDKENDLPDWFSLGNPRVRSVIVPKPDHVIRRALMPALNLPGHDEVGEDERKKQLDLFVEQTDGLALTDVIAISQLCRREKLTLREIGEAVKRYKLGVTEDPWKRLSHEKIKDGETFIRRRVKGQSQAVTKSLDIIKRAVTGLSGSQGAKAGGKPRGVMFLAGPTGVGKTELAKTLTELLFGDERAYIRFDMSEFSAEHADQRLMGAPPGYVGYDAGGELTNAIKEKPFSVVLFDEIEKGHPRILDKFLQLLDDGVLTSGRGERVYFSESVIIFTSNLGIYRLDADGNRVLNVSPDEPYAEVERKVRAEIDRYFKNQLNRPEILNRIGENIVVFDFIRPDIAAEIHQKMLANILDRLREQQKIKVTLPEDVNAALKERCIRDLSNGGRGIGNQLEAWFINPLARALFDGNVGEGSAITVTAIEEADGVPVVRLAT
ncbi:MAG: ATP-dependent Clp protease ATP-binding subunit [Verrucomicrobia bacterium]|nr:ATP-dependent Clp protease ATP-binding subunit [Verrucomicrobiota bacterium]